jgi:hypothetical protein
MDIGRSCANKEATPYSLTLTNASGSLWYGPKAIPEYAQTFNCPFSRPTEHYQNLIEAVERKAKQLNVILARRRTESNFIAGKAASSKARSVRRYYKALCRRASLASVITNSSVSESSSDSPICRLDAFRMVADKKLDETEVLANADETPVVTVVHANSNLRASLDTPSLAYRVWDNKKW